MSGTRETTIRVTGLHAVGRGVDRPEQVVVAGDGRVFASDNASAVAELIDENTVRRVGQAGGEPNGIALDRNGHFLIANFGLGVLQDLDLVTGAPTSSARNTASSWPTSSCVAGGGLPMAVRSMPMETFG
jgi:gluconolactonase